jgi:hypothetical protein
MPHPKPHLSIVSVVLTCSAAPRSRAPPTPIALSPRLPCASITFSTGQGRGAPSLSPQLQHTQTAFTYTSTSQPHCSFVSVLLTCSAAPRSRAPSSPMLLKRRLANGASVSTGQGRHGRATTTATHPHRPHVHPHPHPHSSLQRRQGHVDLQRRAKVPRSCIADVVSRKAAHVQV